MVSGEQALRGQDELDTSGGRDARVAPETSAVQPPRRKARGEALPFFGDPSVLLFGLVVSLSIALRYAFFREAEWVWGFAGDVDLRTITPWTRWALSDRDGAEPYALIAIVGLLSVGTALGVWLLRRLPPLWQAAAGLALFAISVDFAIKVPPLPPIAAVAPSSRGVWLLIAVSVLATFWIQRRMRRNSGIPKALLLALVPVCFIRIVQPSTEDLLSILAPALRLSHGVAPSHVYMQYDLFPSLLAIVWRWFGAASASFTLLISATFYAMFLGLFLLARRLFSRPELAAPMLVCMVLVRYYGVIIDANATPQVTPMRLELWVPLLAVSLAFGLRHWSVGLVVGGLFFFSRSVGMLYVGAYALALGLDFLANRYTLPASHRRPFLADVERHARECLVSLGFVAISFVLVRLVFGSFGSDAVALYRKMGVGMMRIDKASFYWWLLPLTGGLVWLAVSRRGSLGTRQGQATIFAVALIIANSSYFFGRSHEHNLINLGSSFLFGTFLALDLAWPSRRTLVAWCFAPVPWAIVVTCAYYYSGRTLDKVTAQAAQVLDHAPLPLALSDYEPFVDCTEIAQAVPGSKLYFFARHDYWLYERCDYEPPTYTQPMGLAVLKDSLATQMKELLAEGYVIVVPRQAQEWSGYFLEFLPMLGKTTHFDTPHYHYYRRAGHG